MASSPSSEMFHLALAYLGQYDSIIRLVIGIILGYLCTKQSTPVIPYVRPEHIVKSIEEDKAIFYLGVGSNLSQDKVVNRGVNGTKIAIKSFVPCRIENHRLAFNVKG